jgi:MFS transporter, Spinster family, sphingosine-1-phosphate transporter
VGIHQMGIYCGVILGGFSGYAADSTEFGWRWAFKWIGLLGLIYAIPLIAMLRDVRAKNDSVDRPSTPLLETLGTLLGNLSFILLVLYFTLPAMAGWVIRDWMPSLLKDTFPEIGQGLAGVSATIWQVAAIVAAVGGGFLADYWMLRNRRGRIYVSAIGMSMLIPALILVGQATSTGGSLNMAVGALILFGLGWGFFDCNNMPILCQIVRPQFRATGYGIMNLVSISCGGFADRIFGVLKDREVPMFTIFGLFASVCVVSVILVLLIRPTLTDDSNSQ